MNNFLNNQFLIAMPSLKHKGFSHTVTYLYQHDQEGALGVIINRPTPLYLDNILSHMEIKNTSTKSKITPIYLGGPVQREKGFVIHDQGSTQWESSIVISERISLTSSRDILEAIAQDEGPENYLIALGYVGWSAGQLEKEIMRNIWLNTPYEASILYQTPVSQRWVKAANLIGININLLTPMVGHG